MKYRTIVAVRPAPSIYLNWPSNVTIRSLNKRRSGSRNKIEKERWTTLPSAQSL